MPTFHDETVQIRIEEQLHIRPFGPEDPLLVEHKWFVRCQYGQVSRKPLVAFPSDLFEMLGERRIVRYCGGLGGVRCEPPPNPITEFGLGHIKTAADGDTVEPKPHRVGRPRRIMFFASPNRDAEVRLVRRLVVRETDVSVDAVDRPLRIQLVFRFAQAYRLTHVFGQRQIRLPPMFLVLLAMFVEPHL